MSKLIDTCSDTKEAWETFKTAHEGISEAHMSKLLITRFENIRMKKEIPYNMKAYIGKYFAPLL